MDVPMVFQHGFCAASQDSQLGTVFQSPRVSVLCLWLCLVTCLTSILQPPASLCMASFLACGHCLAGKQVEGLGPGCRQAMHSIRELLGRWLAGGLSGMDFSPRQPAAAAAAGHLPTVQVLGAGLGSVTTAGPPVPASVSPSLLLGLRPRPLLWQRTPHVVRQMVPCQLHTVGHTPPTPRGARPQAAAGLHTPVPTRGLAAAWPGGCAAEFVC
jgi:hypothetical protein